MTAPARGIASHGHALDAGGPSSHPARMDEPRDDEPRDDELPPSEAARARRRDHNSSAHERAGMRTGLAKGFKQILDAQARRSREADEPDTAAPAKKRTLRSKRPKPPG